MKKKIGICLFLVLAVLGCGLSCAGGYYIRSWQKEKTVAQKEVVEPVIENQASDTALINSLESAVVIPPYEFVLSQEDGYVVVYYADGETLHSRTDIKLNSLPVNVQAEITEGKEVSDEVELYNFLENYSS